MYLKRNIFQNFLKYLLDKRFFDKGRGSYTFLASIEESKIVLNIQKLKKNLNLCASFVFFKRFVSLKMCLSDPSVKNYNKIFSLTI